MFPLDWLLAITGIGVFASGIATAFFWKLFCEARGGISIELATSVSFIIFLLSLPTAIILLVAAIFVSFGPAGSAWIAGGLGLSLLILTSRSKLAMSRLGR